MRVLFSESRVVGILAYVMLYALSFVSDDAIRAIKGKGNSHLGRNSPTTSESSSSSSLKMVSQESGESTEELRIAPDAFMKTHAINDGNRAGGDWFSSDRSPESPAWGWYISLSPNYDLFPKVAKSDAKKM